MNGAAADAELARLSAHPAWDGDYPAVENSIRLGLFADIGQNAAIDIEYMAIDEIGSFGG